MFNQPSGVSLYEGRTRGKRIKYTFSDDDEEKTAEDADDSRSRRSANTPQIVPEQPRYTASGRMIRKPQTGVYGEVKINGSMGTDTSNAPSETGSTARRYNNSNSINDEWDGDSQGDDDHEDDEQSSDADDESEWDDTQFLQQGAEKKSLRIILKVNRKDRLSRTSSTEREFTINGGGDHAAAAVNGRPRSEAASDKDVIMGDAGHETLANGHGPPPNSAGVAQAV